jgi:guanylate kinase
LSERALPSLIIISAPSGAGKTSVIERVLKETRGLRFSVSHTTRAPRGQEQEGVQYHFVSSDQFEQMKSEDAFIEWAAVHGRLYGTSRAEMERATRDGLDLLLDIDVQGARQVRERVSGAVSIFILPPSFPILEQRLRARGQDAEAQIRKRLGEAWREMQAFNEYDCQVINDNLDECVRTVCAIITAARARTSQNEMVARQIMSTFPDRGASQ